MSDFAIQAENLGKCYRITHETARPLSLRETLTQASRHALDRLLFRPDESRSSTPRHEAFWALRDLNFEIKAGETVAIIGANGAGKSTLLKILSRVTAPTTGSARIHGRVASLLEVGTGFHPELSGRENIFLNGAILGMGRAEIRSKFDAIVAFAEIENFLDTPVKRYSSGMYTRLAFAVAAHLECEILIVDEVLSVGDAAFQRKSLAKMTEIMEAGRTILFVSHNMAAAMKFCRTGMLLEKGRLAHRGPIAEVVAGYLGKIIPGESSLDITHRRHSFPDLHTTRGTLLREGRPTREFFPGETITLQIEVEIKKATPFAVEFLVRDEQGQPLFFAPSGLVHGIEYNHPPGNVTIEADIPDLYLAAGGYSVDVILSESGVRFYEYLEAGFRFNILPSAMGKYNWQFRQNTGFGTILVPARFRCLPKNSP